MSAPISVGQGEVPPAIGGGVASVNVKTPLLDVVDGVIVRHEADVLAVQYTDCALNGPAEILESTATEKLEGGFVP